MATAYFEVNAYNSHYADVERRGDTIILKDKMLEKHTFDIPRRRIDKVVYFIRDNGSSPITTVISE